MTTWWSSRRRTQTGVRRRGVYSGVPAKQFGRQQVIDIGPMSGKSNVIFWLERHGIEPEAERVERIFNKAKQCSTVLADEEVMALV